MRPAERLVLRKALHEIYCHDLSDDEVVAMDESDGIRVERLLLRLWQQGYKLMLADHCGDDKCSLCHP